MDNKHTPEPWTVGRELASAKVEITSQPDGVTGACNLIADVHSILKSLGGTGARDANARRIVACVNACQGMPTAALERCMTTTPPLVEMLDELHASAEAAGDMGDCFNMLGVLIAKLRGESLP